MFFPDFKVNLTNFFIFNLDMPGLDKPVGCQLKKENVMKYPPNNNNKKYLNFLPRNENLHDTSADSSNSSVCLQESTNNTLYL